MQRKGLNWISMDLRPIGGLGITEAFNPYTPASVDCQVFDFLLIINYRINL